MNLQIQKISQGAKHLLEVSGEIDAYTATELHKKLIPLTEESGHTVLVDLSKVSYMDSTGLGVFVGALKSAKANNSDIILKRMTDRVRRLFNITGLDEIMTIEQDDVKGGAQ